MKCDNRECLLRLVDGTCIARGKEFCTSWKEKTDVEKEKAVEGDMPRDDV